MKYLNEARLVLGVKLEKSGIQWGPEHDVQAERIAAGLDCLLAKTLTVGHGGGNAAPGSLSGGAALVIDNMTAEEPSEKLKSKLLKLKNRLGNNVATK